tara:strand:- start:690 stop:1613 length:924 start_codon:yes stop_codon:yes gene_type:complete
MDKYMHVPVNELREWDFTLDMQAAAVPLLTFTDGIKKQLRGIKFGVVESSRSRTLHLFAYYPDEVFARGKVSYTDCRERRSGGEKLTFNVSAKSIENNKTNHYNGDLYYRMSSTSMKAGVRNAVKHLRAYTPVEVMMTTLEDLVRHRNSVGQNENYEIRQLSSYLCDSGVMCAKLRTELLHLHTSGHNFIDPVYGEKLAQYVSASKEQAENSSMGQDYICVQVRTTSTGHEFTCLAVDDHKQLAHDIRYSHNIAAPKLSDMYTGTRVTTELPDEWLAKVAVLAITDNDTFLDGIGWKYCDEVYYVYK